MLRCHAGHVARLHGQSGGRVRQPEANGGVTCSHSEIIKNSRFRPLYIGFDADYRHNQCVARAFANLIQLRIIDAEKYGYSTQLKILNWSPNLKGLDDALLEKLSISFITVQEWFDSLDEICRDVVFGIL